jgi:hypothetical protein
MTTENPLFVKFINREVGVLDLLHTFSKSNDKTTQDAVADALIEPPDLDTFRVELEDAVTDMIREGIGEDFKAFVNHYMADSITEDVQTSNGYFGENVSRFVRVKDPSDTWVQGFVCYNVCLYMRYLGLESLKKCKICGKIFAHKGKYAIYCNDTCKSAGKKLNNSKESSQ